MEVGKVVCPHCKNVMENWQDFIDFEATEADFQLDCDKCTKWFNVHMDMTPRFSTSLLAENIKPY